MKGYLALALALRFGVELLLLLAANQLCGCPAGLGRCAPAAGLGAVLAALGLGAALGPAWRGLSLAAVSLAAFGRGLRRWVVFALLSLALEALAAAVGGGSVLSPLLCAGGLWAVCTLSRGTAAAGRSLVPLRIGYQGRQLQLTALRDTGNTLRDPITGEGVLIIGPEHAARLTGLSPQQLSAPLQTLSQRPIPGLRLIPYRTVGQGAGLLLALRLGDVQVGTRRMAAVVAFAPEAIGRGEGYQALTGGTV